MARAGSTVQYQIVMELIESSCMGMSIGWIGKPTQPVIQALDNAARRQDRFLVVKCHDYTKYAGEMIKEGYAKGVYIYRDLRDVLVSLGSKFYDSIEQVLLSGSLNCQIRNYYTWTQFDGMLVSKYEDSMHQLESEVLKIADYLGLQIDKKKAESIAKKLSIAKQMKVVQKLDLINQERGSDKTLDVFDPKTQLHNNHIRCGESGQWKRDLSFEQAMTVENIAFSWLVDREYITASLNRTKDDFTQQLSIQGKDDFDIKLQEYKDKILLNKQDHSLHYKMGMLHYSAGNFSAAENAYWHAIRIKPSSGIYRDALTEILNSSN